MPSLPEDAVGYRPGHPEADRGALPRAEVARRLDTSAVTVTAWLLNGKLDGFWHRPAGQVRYRYFVYEDACDTYLYVNGPVHGQRQSPTGTASRQARELAALVASVEDLRSEVGALHARLAVAAQPAAQPGTELAWERARRIEMEQALEAVALADESIALADRARDEHIAHTRDAYLILRSHVTGTRIPRDGTEAVGWEPPTRS